MKLLYKIIATTLCVTLVLTSLQADALALRPAAFMTQAGGTEQRPVASAAEKAPKAVQQEQALADFQKNNVFYNTDLFDNLSLKDKIKAVIGGHLAVFLMSGTILSLLWLFITIIADPASLPAMFSSLFIVTAPPFLMLLPWTFKEFKMAFKYLELASVTLPSPGIAKRVIAKWIRPGTIGNVFKHLQQWNIIGAVEIFFSGNNYVMTGVSSRMLYRLLGGSKRPFIATFFSFLASAFITHGTLPLLVNINIFKSTEILQSGVTLQSSLLVLPTPWIVLGVAIGLNKQFRAWRKGKQEEVNPRPASIGGDQTAAGVKPAVRRSAPRRVYQLAKDLRMRFGGTGRMLLGQRPIFTRGNTKAVSHGLVVISEKQIQSAA